VRTCYVKGDASGADDGSNWADAYTDLQSALAEHACDQVWVARGVYKPVTYVDGSSRAFSFNVRPGLRVYGGVAGLGSQRDAAVYHTVLSGDIDNNESGAGLSPASTDLIPPNANNSYHVVVIDGTTAAGPVGAGTIVDGFTITGGNANGPGPDSHGG